jgi:hypothetical protein
MLAPLILLQSELPVTQLVFRLWPQVQAKEQAQLHLSIGTSVFDLTELGYQNLSIVPYGYRYLVATDSSNSRLLDHI